MTTIEIICTVAVAVITVLGGIYAMFQFVFQVGKTKEHLEGFEKNALQRFDRIDQGFDKIDGRMEKIENSVNDHSLALVEIYTFLGQKYPKHGLVFSQKQSPRVLNKLGKKIFDEIEGQKFLDENKDLLFEKIDESEPQTRLDVEILALQTLTILSSDSVFNKFKDYVYEAPAIDLEDGKKYELAISDICFILSIPLRDMYISEKKIA